MVEKSTNGLAETNNGVPSPADQTLAFFDEIFSAVPPVHRQIDKEWMEVEQNGVS